MHPRPAPFDSECSDRVWVATFVENPAALAVVDTGGKFSCVNQAFALLVGRGSEQLVRGSWQSITHPDDITPDADMVRMCMDGDTQGYSLEKRYLTPSGEVVWVRIWVRAFKMFNRVACFLVHAVALDGPGPVTPPAPVVMRPKIDALDAIRDNPKQALVVLVAVITAISTFLTERNTMKRDLETLKIQAEERRKIGAIEDELRMRRQFGGGRENPERTSP